MYIYYLLYSTVMLINKNIYQLYSHLLSSIPPIESDILTIKEELLIYIEYLIGSINNIVENFPVKHTISMYNDIWTKLWEIIIYYSDITLILNTQWTIIRRSFENNIKINFKKEQVESIIKYITQNTITDNRMISVGILDYISQYNNDINIQQTFLDTFLNALSDNSLLVAAEAINGIIDMFSSDDPNPLWQKNGVYGKLKQFLPTYQKKIKNSFGIDKESMSRIKEMSLNLSRFIKYKKR